MKEFVLSAAQGPGDIRIDYEAELNDEQLAVVQQGDGRALVLAGAGSGKTRTITYRVAWLLEHGVAPSNILLLTFTNKAAREMIERIEGLLGVYPDGLWAGTFHSIANRLLRKYAGKIGFQPNFSILDQEDARELIKWCIKELKIDTKGRRFPSASVLHSLISFRRNKNCDMETAIELKHPKFLPILAEIEEVQTMYRRQKATQNAMDFDDLLLHFLDLLKSHPDVQESLSSMFEYVLVDEFQDTNIIQAEIVRRLSAANGNLLVVGDDAQSIYSFRAAEIKNILNFPDQYNDTKTFRLTQNYRSSPEILKVANAVIANNVDQFPKELLATCASCEPPSLVPAASASQEAQYIAEQVLALHDEGIKFSDMAVLFRAAFHSQSLEFELMKRDIPYDYRGGMKFFERAHIKDVVAHLRLVHNIKDGMAWMRVLKLHPGIGVVTAGKIAQLAGQCATLKDAQTLSVPGGKKAQAGWEGFLRVLKDLLAARPFPAGYIRMLASNDDYRAYLENEFPNFRERLEDIEQFALFSEQFEEIGPFLEAVSLTDEYGAVRGQDNVEGDRLVLSTIHQAKGLEWNTVFVMHLAEGSFPSARAMDEADGLEEERRLFYVATTRARRKLFLTYPVTAGYEHVEIKQPSMFIEEIPENQYEVVKLRRGLRPSGATQLGGRGGVRKSSWGTDGYEEPTIVLDGDGERMNKQAPSSFLRDLNDL